MMNQYGKVLPICDLKYTYHIITFIQNKLFTLSCTNTKKIILILAKKYVFI